METPMESRVCDLLTTSCNEEASLQDFGSNSEAHASEFLKNMVENWSVSNKYPSA